MEFELTTTDAVIETLGGNQAVGELTGSNAKAVSNWRSFNAFPAWTYISINSELKRLGKDAPNSLWAMTPPKAKRRPKVRA